MLFPHTISRRLRFSPASNTDQTEFQRAILRTGIESIRPSVRPPTGTPNQRNAAFLVTHRSSGDILGFGTLHGLDPAGHIRAGVYLDPERARLGVGSEAIYLSINYAFAMFDIDKVLAQTTEATFGSVGLNPQNSKAKGILRDFLYFRGRHWDLYGFEIERSEWEKFVDADLDDVLGPGESWRAAPARPAGSS
ncbi:GNAT family N-acetyltransferase [Streptomyces phaeolivaceus]|uniref:GNAT family N-acetyltransferase n=1 Tax=Streptomyces phaeolivaceus TaxID=2653200 RepID=A0A5P8K9B0_9ACTN|nr:GNAT family protein [Streptomyces phaeolivaceus]QFQ99412.1 GNAT family N-acetyltransferase [Streptomyces phaeolivaceus]